MKKHVTKNSKKKALHSDICFGELLPYPLQAKSLTSSGLREDNNLCNIKMLKKQKY